MVSKAKSKTSNLVYFHSDPITSDIVYVGRGQIDRPWAFHARQPDHREWLLNSPFELDEIVSIEWRSLTKEQSKTLERFYIELFKPKFNKPYYKGKLKLTENQYREAVRLRQQGETYRSIAQKFNVKVMTLHRILSGKVRAYAEISV